MGLLQRMADAYEDPARRARILLYFWLISTGFLVFGFLIILVKVFLSR